MSGRTWGGMATGVAACALSLAAGLHLGGGSHLLAVVVSPDGRERVEEYSPTRWQALTAGTRELPATLRVTNVTDGTPIAPDSPIVDLDGAGAPEWEKGDIVLGVIARFDRKTGRWTSYENLTH